ncbi:hypothetical protein [Bhargavaea cecembensis]|uniref:hypothetical protein n=1 Tax=Bhargavaea cecembensis TaxID=394098 RepID=UPI00058F7882|nr:hypothetical protein [Bhargavaea cecembensis]
MLQREKTQVQLDELEDKIKDNFLCQNSKQSCIDKKVERINKLQKSAFIKEIDHTVEQYRKDNIGKEVWINQEESLANKLVKLDYIVNDHSIIIKFQMEGRKKKKVLSGELEMIIPEFVSMSKENRKVINLKEKDPMEINKEIFNPIYSNGIKKCPQNPNGFEGTCLWPNGRSAIEAVKGNNKKSGLEVWFEGIEDHSKVKVVVEDLCDAMKTNGGNNCNHNWGFSNGNVYAKSLTDDPNANDFSDGTVFYNGSLNIHNFKNASNVHFVIRELNAHKLSLVNQSSLVLLGKQQHSTGPRILASYDWHTLSLESGSKACINIENITSDSREKIKNIGINNGLLVLYPDTKDRPLTPIKGKIEYTNDYGDFLSECGVDYTSSMTEEIYINKVEETSDLGIKTEVEY